MNLSGLISRLITLSGVTSRSISLQGSLRTIQLSGLKGTGLINGLPTPPEGYYYLVDHQGKYLVDYQENYVIGKNA